MCCGASMRRDAVNWESRLAGRSPWIAGRGTVTREQGQGQADLTAQTAHAGKSACGHLPASSLLAACWQPASQWALGARLVFGVTANRDLKDEAAREVREQGDEALAVHQW